MKILTIADYIGYFKGLAAKHRSLLYGQDRKSFTAFTQEEIQSRRRDDLAFPCMFLDVFDLSFSSNRNRDMFEAKEGTFLILKPVKKGDFEGKISVLDDCMKIGVSIMKRIHAEAEETGLDLNSAEANYVGTVFGDLHGFAFSFQLQEQIEYTQTPDTWTDK